MFLGGLAISLSLTKAANIEFFNEKVDIYFSIKICYNLLISSHFNSRIFQVVITVMHDLESCILSSQYFDPESS